MPLFVKSPVQVSSLPVTFPQFSCVSFQSSLWPSAHFCFLSASGLGSSHCFFLLSEARFLSVTSFRRDAWDQCKCSLYFGCHVNAVAKGWCVDYVRLGLKSFILVETKLHLSRTSTSVLHQGLRFMDEVQQPSSFFWKAIACFLVWSVCVWWWFLVLLNLVCVPSPVINRVEMTCILKTKKTHSSSVFNPDPFNSLIYTQSHWVALAHCIFCAQIFNKFGTVWKQAL